MPGAMVLPRGELAEFFGVSCKIPIGSIET